MPWYKFPLVCSLALLLCAVSAPAASDQGPQRRTSIITTNANANVITIPGNASGRFDPAWLVLAGTWSVPDGTNAPIALTQTVSVVSGVYTQAVATVTSNGFYAITNLPTLFYGDKFLMTTSGLGTNSVRASIIGRVFN